MDKSKTPSDVKVWVITVVLVILLIAVFYLFVKTSESDIFSGDDSDASAIIGYIGSTSAGSESLRNGIELAKTDSGIEGLEVVYESSECDIAQATSVFNELISANQKTVNRVTKTKVVAVITDLCTESILVLAPLAEQNQIILITPTSESSALTSAGEYTFRTAPSYTAQAKYVSNHIYNKNNSKLSILYENNQESALYADALKSSFRGTISASESQSVIWDKMVKITKTKPDSIFIIGGSLETLTYSLQQIRQSNLKMDIYASDALKTEAVRQLNSAEGMVFISASQGTPAFKQKYQAAYSSAPDKFAAQGYDSFAVLANAIKIAGNDGAAIKNALYSSQIEGASGKVRFDYNGDVIGNFEVFQLKNKQFIPV